MSYLLFVPIFGVILYVSAKTQVTKIFEPTGLDLVEALRKGGYKARSRKAPRAKSRPRVVGGSLVSISRGVGK